MSNNVSIESALRQNAAAISSSSKHVQIDHLALKKYCRKLHGKEMNHWLASSPFSLKEMPVEQKAAYLFVFNSISFTYWGEPKWAIDYDGKKCDGAYGMLACLGKAVEAKSPIFDPKYLSAMKKSALAKILAGNAKIPLFDERLLFLKKLGQEIEINYQSKFSNLIEDAGGSIIKLLNSIRAFPIFDDQVDYSGKQIGFYKRAQLLVSDLVNYTGGTFGFSRKELGELTACADYKLPQVLRRNGVLVYSEELSEIVDNKIEIRSGDAKEVEIRANTVHAVEFMKNALADQRPGITSIEINDYLWLEGQIKLPGDKPYHRTRTTSY